MITKINRKICLEKYPKFPTADYRTELFFFPKTYANYIFTLNSKSAKGHIKLLANEFTKLTKYLELDTLIFLGNTKNVWLCQDNDYKPVKEALNYLVNNKIEKRFNGALQVEIDSLEIFVRHLFWLTRCNSAFPWVHFIDKNEKFIGYICQYGSLHISTINEEVDKLFKEKITKCKFKFLNENTCHDNFGKTSAIKGRKASLILE